MVPERPSYWQRTAHIRLLQTVIRYLMGLVTPNPRNAEDMRLTLIADDNLLGYAMGKCLRHRPPIFTGH